MPPNLAKIAGHAFAPSAVLAAGIMLSSAAAYVAATNAESAARVRFDNAVTDAHNAIESRIHAYSDVLLGVRGLFIASDTVSSGGFKDYIDSLDLTRRYPGIQVIHYARRVAAAEKPAFEATVRKDTDIDASGYPDFKVKPAGQRPEYVVVRYVAPMAGNEGALGLDLGGDAVRLAALTRARDSGRMTASGPIALALDPRKHPGIAMRLPIYRKGMPLGSVAQRREAFTGVVSASFVVIDLMNGALSESFLKNIHVTVHDAGFVDAARGVTPPAADTLLFDSDRLLGAPSARQIENDPAAAVLRSSSDLEVGGRRWELRFNAGPAFALASDRWLPLGILFGGLAITLLLSGLIRSLTTSGDRAGALADSMTENFRKSEASLIEAQRMTLQLIEALPNPIFFKDRNGRYLGVNKAWEQFFGLSREAFIGKSVHDLYPDNPDVAALMHAKDQALWNEPGAQVYETSITGGGRSRDVIYYKATYTRADGGVAGLIGTIIDITERKQVAAALHESDRRFRDLVDFTDGIVWEADAATFVFNSVSNNAERMLGFAASEWLEPGFWASHIHPEDRDQAVQYCASCTGRSEDHEFEYRFIARDGRVVWLHDIVKVVEEDGRPRWLRGLMVDVTERKQAEMARVSLEAQLHEAQKMQAIGTLAGGIAHDFNNIIAAILGNAELAREDAKNNPLALQSLAEICKAGSRARDLVQQILSFSRREPIERKPMALAPVIDEAVRLLRATLPARLVLEVQCDDAVPVVLADATQIQQVLINLATNAMQAMRGEPGHIAIRLDTLMLDAVSAGTRPALQALHARHPGRTVRLAVSDDGPGMDAATLERIFEPFFTTKPVDEGTGLGLSVVLGIVQGHEGEIVVDSAPGAGTCFSIYLPPAGPQAQVKVQAGGMSPERADTDTDTSTVPAHGRECGQHILYIDDDEALVFLVRRLLERRGYQVSGFTDQREGLAALRADPAGFDLVLSDYNMPGMSGLDVARAVAAIRADLPVAVASGFIDENLRAQAGGAGVRELIFKATAVEEFCEAVQRLARTVGETAKSV